MFAPLPVCVDSGSGNPVHSEEHQKEPWCKGLAMVETLHYSAATHSGSAHRGTDAKQRREISSNLIESLNLQNLHTSYLNYFNHFKAMVVCILSHTIHTVAFCALGGNTATEIEAGESGERAK